MVKPYNDSKDMLPGRVTWSSYITILKTCCLGG